MSIKTYFCNNKTNIIISSTNGIESGIIIFNIKINNFKNLGAIEYSTKNTKIKIMYIIFTLPHINILTFISKYFIPKFYLLFFNNNSITYIFNFFFRSQIFIIKIFFYFYSFLLYSTNYFFSWI